MWKQEHVAFGVIVKDVYCTLDRKLMNMTCNNTAPRYKAVLARSQKWQGEKKQTNYGLKKGSKLIVRVKWYVGSVMSSGIASFYNHMTALEMTIYYNQGFYAYYQA